MPASEAQILANRKNAERSTGPKTEAGKARSRANSYQHGLTGEGVVCPEVDASEVNRLTVAFSTELGAPGESSRLLARRLAVLAVRMERVYDTENALLSERVRQVFDEFEAPEGVDESEAAQLRNDACRRAMFDPSSDAEKVRKYEAAAHRDFFKAFKEIRQLKQEARENGQALEQARALQTVQAAAHAAAEAAQAARLASFSKVESAAPTRPVTPLSPAPKVSPRPYPSAPTTPVSPAPSFFEVPIAIGRAS